MRVALLIFAMLVSSAIAAESISVTKDELSILKTILKERCSSGDIEACRAKEYIEFIIEERKSDVCLP